MNNADKVQTIFTPTANWCHRDVIGKCLGAWLHANVICDVTKISLTSLHLMIMLNTITESTLFSHLPYTCTAVRLVQVRESRQFYVSKFSSSVSAVILWRHQFSDVAEIFTQAAWSTRTRAVQHVPKGRYHTYHKGTEKGVGGPTLF